MAAEANLSGISEYRDVDRRVARMEGAFEHLAKKEDLEKLRADLTWRLFIGMGIYMGLIVGILIAYIEWRLV
ncbi:MAG: hypothetical protein OXI62_00970 [Chloroflexota bacterium]|nr:hypothetical protein [Chloroflexota bacterium]